MIRISKIDDKLSIYKENKVILWGCGKFGKKMKTLIEYHNIDILAFCDNNEDLHGTYFEGTQIISPKQLKDMRIVDDKIVVQIAFLADDKELVEQIIDIGIDKYVSQQEAWQILYYIKKCCSLAKEQKKVTNSEVKMMAQGVIAMNLERHLLYNCFDSALILCMPTKTGDHTLNYTFQKNNVSYFNLDHAVQVFEHAKFNACEKIKVITAIREPISQNISIMNQYIFWLSNIGRPFETLHKFDESILKSGGDMQSIFDAHMKLYVNNDNGTFSIIQTFISEFQKYIIDYIKHPFNKEKGYSIIKEDKFEYFVFQLEKLDNLICEISDFVEISFEELVIGHKGAEHWTKDMYKQMQKEIEISQEYFDKCFDEDYVKHCYLEEDIEKFKERWRLHIRK